ncbi:22799_t:CDS:2 [Gigaspora margarita]|uniref:22799_t:CDS:1 n=1 Tax=Gigaspora margarita TaxID=4874 RepID=A0ABN7WJL0_GIGMA|nr:22799_t:CDS:2 [Gigaspora margarita]
MEVKLVPHFSTTIVVEPILEISVNAIAQKKIADEIEKLKMLTESQEVVRYDKVADPKRRKKVIKVRIIDNLCKNLEEKYNIYMARTILNNYLLSRQTNSIATKAYRHPVWVAIASISRTDTQEHPDRHYCLDDKAKVGLGVLAVGRTFRTLQSINEPVVMFNHDFPVGYGQKLIPSVYLMIKPNELTDEIQTGQLAIFIRPNGLLFESTEKEKTKELKRQEKQKKRQNTEEDESLVIPKCFVPWSWIESHCNLYTYSIDIKKCKNISCCRIFRAKEAMKFLECYNSFLPFVTRAKDEHYANPIHLLQYYDLLKILGYDAHCLSLEKILIRVSATQTKGQKVFNDFYLLSLQRSSQIDTIDEILFELKDSISDEEL